MNTRRSFAKLRAIVSEETAGLEPELLALHLARGLRALLRGQSITELLRILGAELDEGVSFTTFPRITGRNAPCKRLSIGPGTKIGAEATIELMDRIQIGARVKIGTRVLILTTSHEIGPKEHRAGPLTLGPVVIESDAVLGDDVIVLAGTTIGAQAIIENGSVLTRDVPPGAHVGGSPAAPIKSSSPKGSESGDTLGRGGATPPAP